MPNERIEWTFTWNEDADTDKPRCLAIGDSIIWGSKGDAYKALNGKITLSTFATSKGVDSPYLLEEIKLFCKQSDFRFEAVYFNNGLHTHGQSPKEYGENYERILSELRSLLPSAKFILGLSTPISEVLGDPTAHAAPITAGERENLLELDRNVLAYNQEVLAIAEKENLPVFDAYSLMKHHADKKKDPYHYNDEGRQIFGSAVAEQLLRLYQSIKP